LKTADEFEDKYCRDQQGEVACCEGLGTLSEKLLGASLFTLTHGRINIWPEMWDTRSDVKLNSQPQQVISAWIFSCYT
jgi:hypothetical protein